LRFDGPFRITSPAKKRSTSRRRAFTSLIEVLVEEVAIGRRGIHGRTRPRAHGVTTLLQRHVAISIGFARVRPKNSRRRLQTARERAASRSRRVINHARLLIEEVPKKRPRPVELTDL